jgi:pre-rRNA-processing protein TSR1
MDKHKFERFLHPGRFVVASIFAPISFPPLPLLVFKEATLGDRRGAAGAATLVASGSLRSVDPDRIVLKKITLSGYPHRVSKRKAVVRFMFHNPEDVRWFKPLELWTKYGRRGRIREPVGTHGMLVFPRPFSLSDCSLKIKILIRETYSF